MPLFDFYCDTCNETYQDERLDRLTDKDNIFCAACESPVRLLLAVPAKPYEFHEGLYPELMGYTNKTPITSKKQLAHEAEKRGKYSDYATG